MQSCRRASIALLMAATACARSGGAAATSSPSPEVEVAVAGAPTDSRGCPRRDPSRPDPRPTVAVMYFTVASATTHADYAPFSKGLEAMVVVALSANCRIRVVEREQLQQVLKEQNIPESRVDQTTAVRVGRLLGAHHMIMGTLLVDPQDDVRITASAVNTETSEHEADVMHAGSARHLFDLVPVLARRLNDTLKLPPMPTSVTTPAIQRNPPGKAADETTGLMLYSRALEAEDRGKRAEAVNLYRASLERFPGYPPTRAALRKLQGGR